MRAESAKLSALILLYIIVHALATYGASSSGAQCAQWDCPTVFVGEVGC